jgi:hypothetical protein
MDTPGSIPIPGQPWLLEKLWEEAGSEGGVGWGSCCASWRFSSWRLAEDLVDKVSQNMQFFSLILPALLSCNLHVICFHSFC